MKHHKKNRKFGRVRKVRVGLIRSLARELVIRGSIKTTIAKAKELRPFIEKLITLGKKQDLHSLRIISSRLGNSKDVAVKIQKEIATNYKERSGGYTRIIKLGRTGDRMSEESKIEFV